MFSLLAEFHFNGFVVNANSRSKDVVDVAIEKYKDHPSTEMINEMYHLNHILVLKK